MDESKQRRKSVKSRRRSLRNLQPVDVGSLGGDRNESICDVTLGDQLMYGSVWIEQAESPAPVRKPRRSVSCSQISQDLANSVVRNKSNVYGNKHVGKENFSPESSPLKMVEETPKRMPAVCLAKSSDCPLDNCSMEDVWNNSYGEIGVPRFGHRAQDGSVSEESLVGTISILSIDEMDIQCHDKKVDCSAENELQVSSDSFSEMAQNKIDMESERLSPDQLTTGSLKETDTSLNQESTQPSLDTLFDSVSSCPVSPDGVVCEKTNSFSTVEDEICNLPVLSAEENSEFPSKDSSPTSLNLCQDFQQLDISKDESTGSSGNSSDATGTSDESDLELLDENELDPVLASDETFSAGLLDGSSLDGCCSQPSDSWCFIKCYSDEETSDASALIDLSVSDGCEIWETDLSSAGSELSDSWCFGRSLNTADHFNSTPCKITNPTSREINNDQSVKQLIFTTMEDESLKEPETIVPVDIGSSGCVAMEPSAIPLEKEDPKLPAIEYLSLEDSCDLNEEHVKIQQESSQIKATDVCLISNDDVQKKDKHVKTLLKKTLIKRSTQQNSNSKTQNLKPSLKTDSSSIQRKPVGKSEKSSSNQPLASTVKNNKNSRDLTRKSSTLPKKQAAINPETSVDDKLKSPRELQKNLGRKREPLLGVQLPNEKSSISKESSRNTTTAESKSKFQSKSVSPDIIIVDSLTKTPKINKTESPKERVKTLGYISKTTEKRRSLKGSSKSVPVETPPQETIRSFDQTGQQVDTKQAHVSNEKPQTESILSKPSTKKKLTKGSYASSFEQVSSVPTSATRPKRRSLDSLATSTVTIRRLNTQTRLQSTDSNLDRETPTDLVPEKEITKPPTSKREKLRRRALVVPALDTDDVMVVDVPPLTSENSENILSRQVTTRTKRRCQSIGSAYFSIEETVVNDDPAALPPTDSAVSLGNQKTPDANDVHITANNECSSVGSAYIFTGGSLQLVDESPESVPSVLNSTAPTTKTSSKVTRGKRKCRSMGSVSAKDLRNTSVEKAESESKPVKILNDGALAGHSQKPTPLRRSTRRSSIELSLSMNPNPKQTSSAAQSNNNTSTIAQSNNSLEIDDNEEELKEIYAKKPYVPISPSRLETIYSPTKKRGESTVFGKRKLRRTISFQPSETQLKKRRNKALRNWPFLFEVTDVDEKLDKLLNTA